jgi:hypothetical protein
MIHLKIYLSILIVSLPGALPAQGTEVKPPSDQLVIEQSDREFDPASATSGTLPSPVPDPRTPSPVPKSGFFYILPIIGLWMMLRRRSYRGSRG